ncbi:MAG: chemotaxis protein CheB [Actinomycetota bacterium]|nr:chemotaxis protein CheB [Actinomycetota bacterium]
MPKRDVVVVAASAGGIEALREVLGGLPADFAGSLLVVVHMPPNGGAALQSILSRWTTVPVSLAVNGGVLRPGNVFVCVGGHHLLLASGHMHLTDGPSENGHRPSADPLFRSAAANYGPRVVGVILSGTLSDGTAGLLAVRREGGVAVVQDPSDALYDGMPNSALELVGADHVAKAADIGGLLGKLASQDIDEDDSDADREGDAPDREGDADRDTAAAGAPRAGAPHGEPDARSAIDREVSIVEGNVNLDDDEHPGAPSPWPCPQCNGVLWEIEDGPVLRFRCRVGHAWTAENLLHEQADGVEGALWMALRALEDRAALSRKLADRADQTGRRYSSSRYRGELGGMSRSIEILRDLLVEGFGRGRSTPVGKRRAADGGADE